MGDCVLTTPALGLLERSRPDLHLAVVVEDRFRAVFEGNPGLDALLPPSVSALRAFRPDLCLNLHGGGRSAGLTALSGAHFRAGFAHFRFPWIYNLRIPRAQQILGEERTVHTAEHLASAVFYLGVPRAEIPRARLFAESSPISGQYAVLHPFASEPGKTWPADRFAAVAGHLQASGLQPVFLAGPGDDTSPFARWRVFAAAPLGTVKSLMSGAALFLGNDSGPAHIAAAFGVPVVVIFGTSNPAIWHPWRTASEVIHAAGTIADVPVSRVVEALERLRVHA